MSRAPVALFDSGLGGLSVAGALRDAFPREPLLYLADTAWCPYGDRPLSLIRERSVAVGRFLANRGAKVLVIACNSASGAALEALRAELRIPVVGLEPALKPAVRATRNGRIGVMATAATLRTERFARLVREHASGVRVVPHACPGLVELVESGDVRSPNAQRLIEAVLRPLRERDVDTVVLGCTHYPFLREGVQRVMGSGVTLVESGPAVARQALRLLHERGVAAGNGSDERRSALRVLTTGDAEAVRPAAERVWGEPMEVDGVRL